MLGLEANRTVSGRPADRRAVGRGAAGQRGEDGAELRLAAAQRARRTSGAEILTHGRGYELRIDSELVDVCRLERLVAEAARAAEAGEPGHAARAALALFRGEPLADVADEPFAAPRSAGSRSCAWTPRSWRSTPTWPPGATRRSCRDRRAAGREPAARAAARAADARALPLRAPGRGARGLPRGARARWSRRSASSRRRSCGACTRRSCARTRRSTSSRPRAELPRELDAAALPPLVGRDAELRRLRAHWRARGRRGGWWRSSARTGWARRGWRPSSPARRTARARRSLYAAGTGPPEAALAALARARERTPTDAARLDDADRAPAAVRAALRELARALGAAGARARHRPGGGGARAARAGRVDRARAARRRGGPRDRRLLRARRAADACRSTRCSTRAAASRGASTRRRASGRAARRRAASTRWPTARPPAAARRARSRPSWPAASSTCSPRASARGCRGDGDRRRRSSARTRAWRPSTPTTPSTSSGASGSSPSSSRAWSARRCSPSSGRRAAASRRSSAPGCCPRSPAACCPAASSWTQALIRPGEHPLRELRARDAPARARVARRARGRPVRGAVHRLPRTRASAREFVAALVRGRASATAASWSSPCAPTSTAAAPPIPSCRALLGANHVLVGPMSRDELRARDRAARRERVGLSVEPELVDALLADVEGQPGRAAAALHRAARAVARARRAPPAARRLRAQRRRPGRGRAAGRGRVRGARAGAAGRRARRCCCAWPTRARAARSCAAGVALAELDARSADVAGRLADRRLLTVSDGTVEVAHEALLREWPRLRGWLDEDVQGRRLHRRLGEAARAWDADGRDAGELYRGARLAAALDWAAEHDRELNATERAFLDASRRASGARPAPPARRARGRGRAARAGGDRRRRRARPARQRARPRRPPPRRSASAPRRSPSDDLDRSLLLARQGVALDDSPQTRGNLLAALLRSPAAIGVMRRRRRPADRASPSAPTAARWR